MKATCDREKLLSAFQMVSGVVPSRSPKPILLSVKLIAEQGSTYFLATDLEVGIRARVEEMEVQEPGEVILPTVRLAAILHESTDEKLQIETDEERGSIRGDHSQFHLATES